MTSANQFQQCLAMQELSTQDLGGGLGQLLQYRT